MAEYKQVVYFAHGKESGPWGTKIEYLAVVAKNKGFDVESPDYSGMMDPNERVDKLLGLNPQASEHLVLVGSSMGAWVTLKASEKLNADALFLMAPAVYIGEGFSEHAPAPHAKMVDIVHGWNDDVVPVDNAIRFAREHQARLHLLNAEHRLNDQLLSLGNLFEHLLNEVIASH